MERLDRAVKRVLEESGMTEVAWNEMTHELPRRVAAIEQQGRISAAMPPHFEPQRLAGTGSVDR
jgi:hypothetical protein